MVGLVGEAVGEAVGVVGGLLRAFFHKLCRILHNRMASAAAQGFTKNGNGLNSTAVNPSQKVVIAAAGSRITCADYSAALVEIALRAHQTLLPNLSEESLLKTLMNREEVSPTSTPEGVAFPHAICDAIALSASGTVILTLAQPIQWRSHQVQIVVGLFGSPAEPWRHVRSLARVARICSQADIRQELMLCNTDKTLLDLFDKKCNNHE